MDYTQRHFPAMEAIRKSFDENKDEVLKVLVDWKIPSSSRESSVAIIFNKIMETAYPANTKKSGNAICELRNFKELDLWRLNCEWQEEAEGLLGLMKHNNTEDRNVNGN